ncbi:autotransporter outer membrane beta-barrel domain-containing protein [Microvirga sp. W0021]|uniref:Autotransporter outer membrane beta-barrel domain-containing protein n=1 Tax=Hohaiivirga grylli TaxID=3133970 RepID=A0ABV0BGM9_9HYPH
MIISALGEGACIDITGSTDIRANLSVGRAITTNVTSANPGGIVNINNLDVELTASQGSAGYSIGVGIEPTRGIVNVTGTSKLDISSEGEASGIRSEAGEATLSGPSAHFFITAPVAYGIETISNGSTVTVNNMTADVVGTTSAAVIYNTTNVAAATNDVTINTGTLHSSMDGVVVDGGTLNATLNNVTLTNDSGIAFKVGANATGTYAGSTSLSLNADASQFTGIAMTDALSQFDLLLKNNSSWTVTGDSTLSSLRNENSTVAFSSPANNVFKTLTVTNYTGNNGTLILNTVLGTDASPSDLLVIDGGTATGTTNLVVMNAGGLGALTTGDGILVIETVNGGTTDAGAFVQSSRIAAGAYDYTLVRGGSMSDDNWYLTSAYMPPDEPGGSEEATDNGTVIIPRPNYRPEIALASAIQPIAAEYGYAMLDTLHERVGDTFAIRPFEKAYEERVVRGKNGKRQIVRVPVQPSAESQKWFAGAWGRLFGNRGFQDRGGSFLKNGPKYDYTFGGIQAGLDIYGRETTAGTDKAGIYVGYGNISANVKGAYGGKAGSIDMDAYTIGAYWTHKATQGWYTDAVVQGTWYTTDATSIYGQKLKPDGFGFIASLEGGYSFDLGDGLMLEPQVQLAYQHLSFDSFSDAYGRFSIADGDSLRGRIGARLVKNCDMSDTGNGPRQLTTWLRANIWHEFMGKTKTTVTDTYGLNGVTIPSNLGGTWGEIGAGASMLVSENVTMFATGAYSRSLDNKGREAWDGRLGMTVKW